MTKNEAIKEFQQNIDMPFGSNISREASELAIQAIEKQIPKKPRKTDSYRGVLKKVYAYVCPTCGNVCLEKYMNERQNTVFCWDCGQKLDWSDEE
jgi:predicted SprT family Zn-dependent metalloprotease